MSILHVVFKVSGADYVVAAADVLQMESYAGATRVPGALPYVAGVVQVRGRVVPIVDLRVRFGLPAVEPTLDSRIVVVQYHDRTVGLLVDSAREVIKLTPEQLQAPPRLVADGEDGFVKAVAHLGQRMLMLVDFVKVIGEDSIHVS
jgi:purine-binding chemotaxis protein CheW